MQEKLGIIDVGGGYRGVYGAGVLDYCLDNDIKFDVAIGISAGSANLVTYAAGQARRTLKFYTEYGMRKEYASVRNFIFKRSFVDLDYCYGTLSNSGGEYPLDFTAIQNNPMKFIAVATNAITGEAKYFTAEDMAQDNYNIMKASSALPFASPPYEIAGNLYFDGGLSDLIPIKKAFDEGCDRIVLILTKPRDTIRTPEKDTFFANRIKKKYPKAAKNLIKRAETYNNAVALAKELEKQGKVLIVAPKDTFGVDTLTKNPEPMKKLYELGYQDGKSILNFIKKCEL